jgi:hypothetical protein
LPRPKRSLTIDCQHLPDIPHPVKITHLREAPARGARLSAP